MVKAGEVYQKDHRTVDQHEARPRCIFNPSENACGLLVYVQQYIFNDLKSIGLNGKIVEPAFIHAMNSEQLVERIQLILQGEDLNSYSSVSIDGSAFDSNQHVEN